MVLIRRCEPDQCARGSFDHINMEGSSLRGHVARVAEGAAARGPPSSTIKPCTNCRRRKVRCDKNNPCSNCVRSGNRCVYERTIRNDESGSSHDAASTAELHERVTRLENLLESMAAMNLQTMSSSQQVGVATEPPISGAFAAARQEVGETDYPLGREVFDTGSSTYVDPSAWSELFERVGMSTTSGSLL